MDVNDKIKEVSDKISRQLERDIEMFGSSYLEIGELSVRRVDPTTINITLPVTHEVDADQYDDKSPAGTVVIEGSK